MAKDKTARLPVQVALDKTYAAGVPIPVAGADSKAVKDGKAVSPEWVANAESVFGRYVGPSDAPVVAPDPATGDINTAKAAADKAKAELVELKSTIAAKDKQIADLTDEVESLKGDLAEAVQFAEEATAAEGGDTEAPPPDADIKADGDTAAAS